MCKFGIKLGFVNTLLYDALLLFWLIYEGSIDCGFCNDFGTMKLFVFDYLLDVLLSDHFLLVDWSHLGY